MPRHGGEESLHEAMEEAESGCCRGSKKVFFLALARLRLDAVHEGGWYRRALVGEHHRPRRKMPSLGSALCFLLEITQCHRM